MATTKQSRTRTAVVPPASLSTVHSVLDYLMQCTPPLHKKIIDIACAQTQVPSDLKEDASQEISIMWAGMTPDTSTYKPGQIAAYAHYTARHAALRLRRELGAPVRLPGSAFRKRKDGSSYVTPGLLSNALSWDELEGWFSTEGGSDPSFTANAPAMDVVEELFTVSDERLDELNRVTANEPAEMVAQERLKQLEDVRDFLTERQYNIMAALIDGATYEDLSEMFDIKRGVLVREVVTAGAMMSANEDFAD